MKRIMYAAILLLGMSIIMSSCQKEAESHSSDILGHWELVKAEASCDGEIDTATFGFTLIFYETGLVFWDWDLDAWAATLPYNISGNKLSIHNIPPERETFSYTIKKLTQSELVLLYDYEDGDWEKYYFRKEE